VANALNAIRRVAVGFIDWLDAVLELRARCWSRARPLRWEWPRRRRSYSKRLERATELDRRAAVKRTSKNMHAVGTRNHRGRVEMKGYHSVAVCYDKRARRSPVYHQIARLNGSRVNWITHVDNEISRIKNDKPTDWTAHGASSDGYLW